MTAKANRRWFQFSLRTLLVFMTVAGFGLGYVAYERGLAVKQHEIKAELLKENINVLGFKSPRPDWLKGILGDDTVGKAKMVVIRRGPAARSPQAMNQTAANLKYLPNASSLVFEDPRTDDEMLGRFRELTHLQSVMLDSTQVTDQGLQELREFSRLKQLNVMGTGIGDAGLQEMARHYNLEILGLGGTKITDAGLPALRSLGKLQWLNLANTSVTDAGLEELGKFPALQEVVLRGTRVTDVGIRKLQSALPKLTIVHESLPQNAESPIY